MVASPLAIPAADPASPARRPVDTSRGRIRLRLYREFEPAKPQWTDFQARAVGTHAQTYVWAEAWHRLVSRPVGRAPAIVLGIDARDDVKLLWPFEVSPGGHLTWIGQEHASYNMGLYDRDFAEGLRTEDTYALLRAAIGLVGGVGMACFARQPLAWEGTVNPLAKLPHQPSASQGHAIALRRDFDALFKERFGGASRGALKRKERKLAEHGPVAHGWAGTLGERMDVLDAFFSQKTDWFAASGIADPFAPRHRAFYRAMAALDTPTDGQLRLGYLKVGGDIAATFIGFARNGRFDMLLSSITSAACRRWSPGMILLRHQVEDLCRSGYEVYDLGAGEARHKDEWADTEIPLFDSFIGIGVRGRIAAFPLATGARAKHFVKSQPRLWALTRMARRVLLGRPNRSPDNPSPSD